MMTIVTGRHGEPAENQIVLFKEKTSGPIAIMTTGTGAPIENDETSTLNKPLIFNEFFMESMTHLVRERIPERVVHAKGAGAFGYFEVTHDVTDICKANFLNKVGKRTPIAVRFSPVAVQLGGIDTARESRGFGVKFYTEHGNFDIVGLNLPLFFMKDPILFPSFAKILKRNPATGLNDLNMLWDFITLHPESLHAFLFVFGDLGIPYTYRHMPGFSIHTFQVVNEKGEIYFVRFHYLPDQGIKSLTSEEARNITGIDQDYFTRDLYNAIGNGNYPSWTLSVQVLSMKDVKSAGFDVFDVTKELPLDRYPLRPVGRFVLNKNPVNNFAEMEQITYAPSNLVPGILGAPDKMFEARRLAYKDAHNYRLGANHFRIPVNCPLRNRAFTYNRDGSSPVNDNMEDIPNYYPNSFNGPESYKEKHKVELAEIYQDPPNNLHRARDHIDKMHPDERKRLVDNIVFSLKSVTRFVQERALKLFAEVHLTFSESVRYGLQGNKAEI